MTDRLRHAMLMTAIIVVAVARIVSTWSVYNHTFDEGAKLFFGMKFVEEHDFRCQAAYPVLAVAPLAVGPFIDGVRLSQMPPSLKIGYGWYRQGTYLLYDGGKGYFRTLSLARAGVLPFFFLCAGVVFLWARSILGNGPAILALLTLTLTPQILAFSGLATQDIGSAAVTALALFAVVRWLRSMTLATSAQLGVSWAAVALTHLVPVLLVAATTPLIVLTAMSGPGKLKATARDAVVGICIAIAVAFLIVWAAFGFSWMWGDHLAQRMARGGLPVDPRFEVVGKWVPVPAPHLFAFLYQTVSSLNHRSAFLLGKYSADGWWYYLLVTLSLKTPLPLLALAAVGAWALCRHAFRSRSWPALTPLAAVVGILAASVTIRVNIGLRYVLAVYAPLAIVAAYGAYSLMTHRAAAMRASGYALMGALIVVSGAAHPDYLPYFNALAGRNPEKTLTDSNIDWGQDLIRLSAELRRRGIRDVTLAYFGTADPRRHGIPVTRRLPPFTEAHGWVAISETAYNGVYTHPLAYAWIRDLQPVTRVGRSIRLYWVPPGHRPAVPLPPAPVAIQGFYDW